MTIRVLAPDVASKIAAGEVIERPASIAKELIENALDAGAHDIRIDIGAGGVQFIRVTDDGCGIPSSEIDLALERHATSKIEAVQDLDTIATLGFRGEALPSIAAVSLMTILSRPRSELAGTFVEVINGSIASRETRASPPGTSITAEHVFRDLPARLKYLKSAAAEAAQVAAVIHHYALAYPSIRFTLFSEGRQVFQSPGSGSQRDVLAAVQGPGTAERAIEVTDEDMMAPTLFRRAKVTGLVSPIDIHRATRTHFSLFVNGRWVRSTTLSLAVTEAYRGLLPVGRHPIVVLEVQVDPAEVDVNVHPTKAEVKFLHDREIFSTVSAVVRHTLTQSMESAAPPPPSPRAWNAIQTGFDLAPTHVYQAPTTAEADRSFSFPKSERAPVEETPRNAAGLPVLRVLGQICGAFIVAEGPNGIYLVDQHRAHERVLFDQLSHADGHEPDLRQLLLEPLFVTLTAARTAALTESLDQIKELGFDLEPFGENGVLVRAVPAALSQSDLSGTVEEILDLFVDQRATADRKHRALALIACKAAIKTGRELAPVEMRELIRNLEQSPTALICPHGSPVMVHLSQAELLRQFGRRQ